VPRQTLQVTAALCVIDLLVRAHDDRVRRRVKVKPNDVTDLRFSYGSVEKLNVSARWGCRSQFPPDPG
jgi:hypothetical protein